MIHFASITDKLTRFQKIMELLTYAQGKRAVQMTKFRALSRDMVALAHQTQRCRHALTMKWFSSLLNEDEKPTLRSSFRIAHPRSTKPAAGSAPANELSIIRHVQKLATFIANRKVGRPAMVTDLIQKHIAEEGSGVEVEALTKDNYDAEKCSYRNELTITGGQAGLIFEPEDNYKFMIIENRTLDLSVSAFDYNNQRRKQAENLIKKINLGDVSCVATDLDPVTQFDFMNKKNKQATYRIRLYGRLIQEAGEPLPGIVQRTVAPWQLGLDVPRRASQGYRIALKQIKFPPKLAEQKEEKITVLVKVLQFSNVPADPQKQQAQPGLAQNQIPGGGSEGRQEDQKQAQPHFFEASSEIIKIKGCTEGVVPAAADDSGTDDEDASLGEIIVDKLTRGPEERFALGLVLRTNDKPIPLVCERLLGGELLNSFEQN